MPIFTSLRSAKKNQWQWQSYLSIKEKSPIWAVKKYGFCYVSSNYRRTLGDDNSNLPWLSSWTYLLPSSYWYIYIFFHYSIKIKLLPLIFTHGLEWRASFIQSMNNQANVLSGVKKRKEFTIMILFKKCSWKTISFLQQKKSQEKKKKRGKIMDGGKIN